MELSSEQFLLELTTAQSAAIRHIEDYARQLDSVGQRELANVLAMSNIGREVFGEAERHIREYAKVGLHFHPDRICGDGRTVVQALAEDGVYRNQFETHISNGKLDPMAGGERAGWEDQVFGGAFSASHTELAERPKYGALHLMLCPDGPCPRFGSCYLLLKQSATHRATFTYMDSHRNPLEKGTLRVFKPIIAALMTESFERRFVLGRHGMSPPNLIEHLLTHLKEPFKDPAKQESSRNLNHYIEAQVHGEISLTHDGDILVADPSFRGTSIEETFRRIGDLHELDLYWHSGFRLNVRDVPDNFRGPDMPSLAARVSSDGYFDAQMIGVAAADLKLKPERWADWGPYGVVLQQLKCLWHVLVQYGEPAQ